MLWLDLENTICHSIGFGMQEASTNVCYHWFKTIVSCPSSQTPVS